jgi:hypothetical protein
MLAGHTPWRTLDDSSRAPATAAINNNQESA